MKGRHSYAHVSDMEGFMKEFTIHGASERFDHTHADLVEEIRLMVEADEEAAPASRQSASRPSFLIRFLTRRSAARLAA